MDNSNLSKEAFVPTPRIPVEVLRYLDYVFPERCPDLSDTVDAIYFKAGQRSVVRYLIRIFEEQDENKLSRS